MGQTLMSEKQYVILASASPRRRELLEQIGVDFRVVVSEADETLPEEIAPWEAVCQLSAKKAMAVWESLPEKEVVIGADTVVALNGRILGKPGSPQEATGMLRDLRGREHFVYTGVTILMPQEDADTPFLQRTFYEATKVRIDAISEEEIREYVNTGDPLDKAGAYGIQGLFARYVKGIEGDYNNVVGLPVGRLYQELNRMKRAGAPKKAAVFDLDGTLSDSIFSMMYSGNKVLNELGLPTFEEKDYKYFVGDGAANLVKRMLRKAGDEELAFFEKAYQRYKEIFAEHCMDGVKPYGGIPELLKSLKERGLKLAVLSNKPHAETIRVVETLFGRGTFDIIQGQEDGKPIKPDPQGVFRILERMREEMGIEALAENLFYLGDTATDIRTGRSAGAYTIGVLWGFRTRDELEQSGADLIISHPMDLI